jgi:hypothetical protein
VQAGIAPDCAIRAQPAEPPDQLIPSSLARRGKPASHSQTLNVLGKGDPGKKDR